MTSVPQHDGETLTAKAVDKPPAEPAVHPTAKPTAKAVTKPTTKPPANRMQKRARRTHDRLLKAALAVFGERGVDSATIEEITERADLGKGTFYRHFESKDQVLVELMGESVQLLLGRMRSALAGRQGLTDMLDGLLTAHTDFFWEHREEFVLLFQGRMLLKLGREDAEGLEQPFIDYLSEMERTITPLLHGPVQPGKVRRVACGLAGFVSGFLSFAMIGLTEKDIHASLAPLRQAFIAATSAMLSETTGIQRSEPANPQQNAS